MTVTSPLRYVHDGRRCLGFTLARGPLGFEAIDRNERSLGLFPSERAAAAVIFKKMPRTKRGKLKDTLHETCSSAGEPAQEF
jgi:hypothetical protein